MGEVLRRRLRQSRADHPAIEALLNVVVVAALVRDRVSRVLEPHGITQGQYNVLRILRGAHPQGYARREVARRMLERAPDVTRLIDRLEDRGLVERTRGLEDRRRSVTRITRRGIELVALLRPEVDRALRELGRGLSRRDQLELSRLCERIYEEEVPSP